MAGKCLRSRKSQKRKPNCHIFIFVEGKTEEQYIESLIPTGENRVKIFFEKGKRNTKLLDKARKIQKNDDDFKENIDEIWIVFDNDRLSPKDKDNKERVKETFEKASKYRIHIAYSDQCFELWVLLHFMYDVAQKNRDVLFSKISEQYKNSNIRCHHNDRNDEGYSKTDLPTEELLPRKDTAVENAKKLEQYHKEYSSTINPPPNPYTSVYKLVERLDRLFKD